MEFAGLQFNKSKRKNPASVTLRNDSLQHFMEAFEIFHHYFDNSFQEHQKSLDAL